MYVLSRYYHNEFLATPHLVRFDCAVGTKGREPTLLLKASTVLLKYVVLGVRMNLVATILNGHLFYGLEIFDDPSMSVVVWSAMEREEERFALLEFAKGKKIQMFLFNELAVNVAWSSISIDAHQGLDIMVRNARLALIDYESVKEEVTTVFDDILSERNCNREWVRVVVPNEKNGTQ